MYSYINEKLIHTKCYGIVHCTNPHITENINLTNSLCIAFKNSINGYSDTYYLYEYDGFCDATNYLMLNRVMKYESNKIPFQSTIDNLKDIMKNISSSKYTCYINYDRLISSVNEFVEVIGDKYPLFALTLLTDVELYIQLKENIPCSILKRILIKNKDKFAFKTNSYDISYYDGSIYNDNMENQGIPIKFIESMYEYYASMLNSKFYIPSVGTLYDILYFMITIKQFILMRIYGETFSFTNYTVPSNCYYYDITNIPDCISNAIDLYQTFIVPIMHMNIRLLCDYDAYEIVELKLHKNSGNKLSFFIFDDSKDMLPKNILSYTDIRRKNIVKYFKYIYDTTLNYYNSDNSSEQALSVINTNILTTLLADLRNLSKENIIEFIDSTFYRDRFKDKVEYAANVLYNLYYHSQSQNITEKINKDIVFDILKEFELTDKNISETYIFLYNDKNSIEFIKDKYDIILANLKSMFAKDAIPDELLKFYLSSIMEEKSSTRASYQSYSEKLCSMTMRAVETRSIIDFKQHNLSSILNTKKHKTLFMFYILMGILIVDADKYIRMSVYLKYSDMILKSFLEYYKTLKYNTQRKLANYIFRLWTSVYIISAAEKQKIMIVQNFYSIVLSELSEDDNIADLYKMIYMPDEYGVPFNYIDIEGKINIINTLEQKYSIKIPEDIKEYFTETYLEKGLL